MKVKISYSVDIEEVPKRVQKLIDEVSVDLNFLANSLPKDVEKVDFRSDFIRDTYEKIDSTRRKLFVLDARLGDALTILDDWRSTMIAVEAAKISQQAPQEPPEEAEDDGVQ